jgi:ABC-type dipeptide/oligopeptide/nickel transport system ATPase component
MDVALQSAETISAGRSPFQLFSAYTEKDRDKFFGREKETDLLYQSVQEANVVLVYGESGTGKTSIVQCGLLNETKHFNWTSILVRRGDDINVSLIQQLQKYGDNDVVNDDKDGVTTLMQEVFLNSFQPILLVFDQFEEIFVFGNPQEREAFAEKIAQIQGMRIPWKMVFIIREDFLAQLDEFEKELPDLFKKRLRIELMDKSHCREV